MAKSADALVNPDLLIWARQSAQMSVAIAAGKLGITEKKLEEWEAGDSRPTINQVRKLSKVYEQSFAAFYLPKAPAVFNPPAHDYRLLPGDEGSDLGPALALEMRNAIDRREIIIELKRAAKEPVPEFNLQEDRKSGGQAVGAALRRSLGIKISVQSKWRVPDKAFAAWRDAVERLGVLVFQTKRIQLDEMRGFSVFKETLPIVVVNRKDSYAGRTFSLMHELAHLSLRGSGVCDLVDSSRKSPDSKIEAFCNEVAGNILVPVVLLKKRRELRSNSGPAWDDSDLQSLARYFAVSREVILRRLLTLGLTDRQFYERKRKQFLKEYKRLAEIRKEKEEKGFVPPSTDALSLAGKPFVRTVMGALMDDRITASDASDYLGLRMKHFDAVSSAVGLQ